MKAHYELTDRRIGMTWSSKAEAIKAARAAGASSVQRVQHTRVGRVGTGTARTIVWSARGDQK